MTIRLEDLEITPSRRAKPGDRFGKLVVRSVGRAGRNFYVVCDCDCGTRSHLTNLGRLCAGEVKACGCLRGAHLRTHGQSRHPAFWRWQGMMRRCYSPRAINYSDYGGRGIRVCERWHEPAAFIADMAQGFSPDLELDREDNDGDYCPDNCRWIAKRDNLENRSVSRRVTFGGETLPLRVWAQRVGISRKLLEKRIFERGWSIDRAFATPVLSKREAAKAANAASQVVRYGVTREQSH